MSINEIAKKEKLTKEVLLREIMPNHDASSYFRSKAKELLSDLGCISSKYDLEREVIIYCFIRLWKEGRVSNLNFYDSFNKNKAYIFSNYIEYYYANINKYQQSL